MDYTRRELGQLLLSSLPLPLILRKHSVDSVYSVANESAYSAAKPNSTFAGVTVGMNVPYNFEGHPRTMPVDDVIAKTTQLNVSAVELRSQPIELLMGAPLSVLNPERGAQKQAAEDLRAWRLKTNPADASKAKKQFDAAGIRIDVVKFDNIYNFSDPEMDYAFALAKAAGARGISCELEVDGSKRVGQFADKHGMPVGYHGHTKTTESMFKEAFSYAKHNWANLDIGHYIAGNLGDPVDFIRRYHDRITHLHVKDRKKQENGKDGDNVPFGQGDTPIKQCLQLVRDNKWPITATIEFEYKVPAGSDAMTEMAKCVEYCRKALEG